MNIYVPIFFLVSLTLAEPPVGDGYPAARSHDHHHNDGHDGLNHPTSEHQRTISEEYGPPVPTSRNAISNEYQFNARSSQSPGGQNPSQSRISSDRSNATSRSSQGYSSAANMQEYDAPKARSENFEGSSATDSNNQEYELSGISQGYSPRASSLSQEYGPPDVSARTLSTEYGMPDVRSTPSQEYGVPVAAARSNQRFHSTTSNSQNTQSEKAMSRGFPTHSIRSQMETNSRSQPRGYSSTPRRSNDASQEHAASKSIAGTDFGLKSPSYVAPERESSLNFGAAASRSLSTSHRTASARNLVSHTQGYNSGSRAANAPHQFDNMDASAKVQSHEIEMASSRTNGKHNDMVPSFPSASSRAAPSSTYLPASPTSRNAMPSQQYGLPEQTNKGYDSAKARALEELLNQEPANYDFSYQIEDQESGSDFGHTETRHGNSAQGSYFVVLPDGMKQTVEYEADERGFRPRISMEPAGGYDDNAQDISGRSAEGPY